MSESKLKPLSDEFVAKSKDLVDVPHFFWILDKETKEFAYFANISDGEACEIIEILAKQYGGEVIDRAIDKLIQEGDDLDFPEILQ